MKHWFSDVGQFRRDPLQFFLNKAASEDGPVVRLRLGPKRIWLVTDAEQVRELLKNDERDVDKGHFVKKLRPIVGHSLLTINGEENQRRRRALHAVFTKGVAHRYVPEMASVIREGAVDLARAQEFSAHGFTAPLTLRMICVAMFGKSVLSRADEELIIRAVKLVEDDLAEELFRPYPAMPWRARALTERRLQAREMMQIVVNRVRDRATHSSVLSALIALGLDDDAIRDELVTMLIAGHHTTGSAAAWLLYYLARDPQLAEHVADEAANSVDTGGEYTAEHLAQAHFSASFVREVLRLYPSAHWFSRDARRPLRLGQHQIRTGDSLLICPWQLHRDPRNWSRPDTFDITRSYTSKAYLPFGAGPRVCIGMSLAQLNLQLIALEIASAFALEFVGEPPLPMPTGSVTLVPPQMTMRALLRERNELLQAAGEAAE